MSFDRELAAQAITTFLRAIGRDPLTDPDLAGTGERVADAFIDELCAGYTIDTRALLESNRMGRPAFASGHELIVLRDVAVSTMCPHHLLAATGTATIAMQPANAWVGVGALASLAQAHARRLTLQERMGHAIVSDIECTLQPLWVGCRLVFEHGCMVSRGPCAKGSRVETVALRGDSTEAVTTLALRALGVGQ